MRALKVLKHRKNPPKSENEASKGSKYRGILISGLRSKNDSKTAGCLLVLQAPVTSPAVCKPHFNKYQISLQFAHVSLASLPDLVALLEKQHFGNGTTAEESAVKNAHLIAGVFQPIDDCGVPPGNKTPSCHLCPGKRFNIIKSGISNGTTEQAHWHTNPAEF